MWKGAKENQKTCDLDVEFSLQKEEFRIVGRGVHLQSAYNKTKPDAKLKFSAHFRKQEEKQRVNKRVEEKALKDYPFFQRIAETEVTINIY